jgi:hypothetical protein
MFHFSFKLYLLSPLSCAYYNQSIHQKATFNNTSVSIPWRSILWAEETGLSGSDVNSGQTFSHIEYTFPLEEIEQTKVSNFLIHDLSPDL